MRYLGDYADDQTVRFSFSTSDATGAPVTLAGSPTVAVYKDDNTTETTTGVTLSVDYDGRTGLHRVSIATTDSFYATGSDYTVVLTAGTVSSISQAGTVLGEFSIQNRYHNPSGNVTLADFFVKTLTIQPDDGTGPGLRIANGAENGPFIRFIDGATTNNIVTYTNVGDLITTGTRGADVLPTSGTIPTVGTGSNQIALSSGNVTVGTINANVITASSIAADAVTEIQSGLSTLTQADIRTATGLASANLDTQLGEIAANAASAATDAGNASTNTTTIIGYLDTEIAAIKTVTDKVDTTLELDGSVWRATTNFFDNAPSGGGGGGDTIQVLPVQAFVSDGLITSTVNGSLVPLRLSKNFTGSLVFAFFNRSNNSAYSLAGKTVRFVAKTAAGASYAKRETGGNGITVGGTDNNQATVTFNTAVTGSALSNGSYVIWIVDGGTNVDGAKGPLIIDDEPLDYP